MCDRRSMTRTLSPNSLAARSATVKPKNPEPTMSRSTDTSTPLRMETTSNEPTVGNPANPHRNQAVASANHDVAQVLQRSGEAHLAELPLQSKLGPQLAETATPGVRPITDPVHHQRLRKVLDLGTGVDHPGEQPVILH